LKWTLGSPGTQTFDTRGSPPRAAKAWVELRRDNGTWPSSCTTKIPGRLLSSPRRFVTASVVRMVHTCMRDNPCHPGNNTVEVTGFGPVKCGARSSRSRRTIAALRGGYALLWKVRSRLGGQREAPDLRHRDVVMPLVGRVTPPLMASPRFVRPRARQHAVMYAIGGVRDLYYALNWPPI